MAPDQSEAASRHPDAMPPDVLGWAERISDLTDEAILIGKALRIIRIGGPQTSEGRSS
jgi:hypothetical protein